jgi:hypothetical protein
MVPACPLLFGSEAHGHGGFASQPIQRQRSHEGEILRAFTCPGAVCILPHRDIQHPMHPVFTFPVHAHHLTQALRIVIRVAGKRADVLPSVTTVLVRYLPGRFHQHSCCQSRPPLPRSQAFQDLCTPHLAGLYASMPAIHLDVMAQHHLLIQGVGTSEPLE